MDPPDEKRDRTDPERQRPDMIGRVLSDRYRIDAMIASGAFGSVYLGAHLHMHKEVAIKILHPDVENFPELVERFEREAVAGAHISHPNVAVASDLGKFDGDSYFLVQEYVPGVTLREVMKAGPLPAERAAYIARQIADALGAAHRHKIVHRDLKPSNIMLVEGMSDFVKLIDFGFARVPIEELPHVPQGDEGPQWEMSQAGVVFGSVSYMAPDVALGMQNVDERSDLYALGLIFYEMLAGQHPFDVKLPASELFELQRNRRPPALREKNPKSDAPEALERVIMRLLEKNPEERYQDAASVTAAIDSAMEGLQASSGRRESHEAPAAPSTRRVAPALDSKLALQRGTKKSQRTARSRGGRGVIASLALLAVVAVLAVVGTRLGSEEPRNSASASGSAPATIPVAAPAVSVVPPQAADAPIGSANARRELLDAATKPPSEAAEAWLRLVSADEKALDDPEIQKQTVALLIRAEPRREATRKVFDKLANDAGELGLDVLYRVVEEEPASGVAQRALPVLYRQASAGRASPALHVTLDIRRLSCSRKFVQLDRAAREGDERTLRELDKLHPPGCVVQKGACCVNNDPRLDSSSARIRERTAAAPH